MLETLLLGAFEARLDGVPLTELSSRKANRLLALLTLERGRRVQRQWLGTALDMSFDALRKSEGVVRECLGDDSRRLIIERSTVTFDTAGLAVDVFEFDRLAGRTDIPSLKLASAMYRGGLLKDWDDTWLLEAREELKESYLQALQTITRSLLRDREYCQADTYLRRFIHLYPEMDSAWAQLIEVNRLAGQTDEAEQVYSAYLSGLAARGVDEGRAIAPSTRVADALRKELPVLDPDDKVAASIGFSAGAQYRFEPVGGAVPLDSPYYVRRPTDEHAERALAPATSFVLIKGARQIGKTSLLARLLHRGRESNARVIVTDAQKVPQSDLLDPHAFLLHVALSLAEQLQLDSGAEACFDRSLAATRCFERFMLRFLLPATDGWVVWGIDEADRLFE